MRGVTMVVGLVAAIIISPASPAYGGHDPGGCYAELSPKTVTAGSSGVSFSVQVYNGAQLPTSLPVHQFNQIEILPHGMVPTDASAPPPWQSRMSKNNTLIHQGGSLDLGETETFDSIGDVDTRTGTQRWRVFASPDFGRTATQCQPLHPGALDQTTIAP